MNIDQLKEIYEPKLARMNKSLMAQFKKAAADAKKSIRNADYKNPHERTNPESAMGELASLYTFARRMNTVVDNNNLSIMEENIHDILIATIRKLGNPRRMHQLIHSVHGRARMHQLIHSVHGLCNIIAHEQGEYGLGPNEKLQVSLELTLAAEKLMKLGQAAFAHEIAARVENPFQVKLKGLNM